MGDAEHFVMYLVLALVAGGCWENPSGGQSPPPPPQAAEQLRLSPSDQEAALDVLGGSPSGAGALLTPGEKPQVQVVALARAGEGDAAVVAALLETSGTTALVRANVLAALVRMQSAEAGAALARHLDIQVVDLVAALGGPDDLPLLDLAAGSDDPVLRAHATAARLRVAGR